MRKTKVRETVATIIIIVIVVIVAAIGCKALGYNVPGLSAITDALGMGNGE